MSLTRKIVIFLTLVIVGFLGGTVSADDTMDVNFDLNPKVITFPSTTITYTIKLTTKDEPKLRAACGTTDLRAYILIAGKQELFKVSDFLVSPTHTRTGTFIAEAHNNSSITYTVQVSCGQKFLTGTNLTLQVSGQPTAAGQLGVSFDASPKVLAPGSSGNFDFKLAFTGSQSYLDSKCGPGNVIWTVYRSPAGSGTGIDQLIPANEVKRGAISNSSFGSGKTIDQNFSAPVTSPGKDFYFKAQATCPDGRVLTTSGPAPQGGVTSGGSGGGGTGTGGTAVPGTATRSYSFNITNPLSGGPEDPFQLINIITRWLLRISIPIAVLFILYAGFLMLTAGPTPAKFQKGKSILVNVVIGLAVIFIGRGFITLIYSVIELGGDGAPSAQGPSGSASGGCVGKDYMVNNIVVGGCTDGEVSQAQVCVNGSWWQAGKNLNQNCSSACKFGACQNGAGACTKDSDCVAHKDIGGSCTRDSDCNSGVKCQNKACMRPQGNSLGEACITGKDCFLGMSCDGSREAQMVIEGRTYGKCYLPN